MEYIIRDYQPEDYDEISVLWLETGLSRPERGDDQTMIEKTLQFGGKFLVMKKKPGNEIVGTSWLTNDGRRLYLHHFGIKPAFQGQNYSKPLLRASLEFAQKLKMQVKLEVHEENIPAVKLYKKAGFNLLGNYKVYIIRNLEKINAL